MAMIESKDRATSDPDARKRVLKEMGKQDVEYLLLWFTDLEGHLKSFAITPAEASIPVFTAAIWRSPKTASAWARIRSRSTSAAAVTPRVFWAVIAVMTEAP